ncbi:MAG: hypothetical protein RMJ56_14035, partial [Gemmataceae bacterium]|nr:hypothetical protein [Gemmata sp.]MDW8198712.1 hypothetical protein [Gemmataceae bacterium]
MSRAAAAYRELVSLLLVTLDREEIAPCHFYNRSAKNCSGGSRWRIRSVWANCRGLRLLAVQLGQEGRNAGGMRQ